MSNGGALGGFHVYRSAHEEKPIEIWCPVTLGGGAEFGRKALTPEEARAFAEAIIEQADEADREGVKIA